MISTRLHSYYPSFHHNIRRIYPPPLFRFSVCPHYTDLDSTLHSMSVREVAGSIPGRFIPITLKKVVIAALPWHMSLKLLGKLSTSPILSFSSTKKNANNRTCCCSYVWQNMCSYWAQRCTKKPFHPTGFPLFCSTIWAYRTGSFRISLYLGTGFEVVSRCNKSSFPK